eukprot:symbB.v1.2.028201.t1/scaffold2965.1/size66373/2
MGCASVSPLFAPFAIRGKTSKKAPEAVLVTPCIKELGGSPGAMRCQTFGIFGFVEPRVAPNDQRKVTLRSMAHFGRGSQGGPYTLRQVYEEVEADVQHRRPVDVRASMGRLGPELLGRGATRMRRKLPFAHPQMLERSRSAGSLMPSRACYACHVCCSEFSRDAHNNQDNEENDGDGHGHSDGNDDGDGEGDGDADDDDEEEAKEEETDEDDEKE